MEVSFNIAYSNKGTTWDGEVVRSKLEALGNFKGKKVEWIRSDLSIKKFNWFTKLVWDLLAKNSAWMRKHLYGVDLNKSRSLLKQIGKQLPPLTVYQGIYDIALKKFNNHAPEHAIYPFIETINENPSKPLEELGYETKEDVLALVKKYGKRLTSLNLYNISKIQNEDIEQFIKYCPNLKHLLINNSKVDDRALLLVARKLKKLKKLSIWNCGYISEVGLLLLKKHSSLHELDLQVCGGITNEGLKQIGKMTSLRKLNLVGTHEITDDGLKELKGLKFLRVLNLVACNKITSKGLVHLKPLSKLQELDLRLNPKIGDEGLEHLKGLKNLRKIILIKSTVSNTGLKHLGAIHSLEDIEVSYSFNITDRGLRNFEDLTNLQKLKMDFCPNVTKGAIEQLKSKLPSLEVKHSGW